jgi:uncharacterized membrane protein YfcA
MSPSAIPHLKTIWLVAASTLAGVMNAMAGGGSFLSFPAMLGMGVLPVQANATNTVALWPGQLTSLATLRRDVRRDLLPAIVITCIVGGVAGAEVLLHTRQRTFLHMIPWLILGGTLIFGVSGRVSKWLHNRSSNGQAEPRISRLGLGCALLPACFYVGYFGAGSGFILMTILALFGIERMHTLNAMKIVTVTMANLFAIATFIFRGAVEWRYCVVSMAFAGLGGWIGARFARRMSGDVLRAVVVATGCVVAAYFFWKQAQGG